jgi:hypothetical protein
VENDAMYRRLTRNIAENYGTIFKLFITCRGRAFCISHYFNGQIIDLEEDIGLDDSSDWQLASLKV